MTCKEWRASRSRSRDCRGGHLVARRTLGLLGVACLLLSSLVAHALELGPLRLTAPQGERATGEVVLTDDANSSDVVAWVATAEAFRTAGLEYSPAMQTIRVTTRRAARGQHVVRLEGMPSELREYDLLLMASNRKATLVLGEYRVDTRGSRREFPAAPVGTRLQAKVAASATRNATTLPPSSQRQQPASAEATTATRQAVAMPSVDSTERARPAVAAPATANGQPTTATSTRFGDVARPATATVFAPLAEAPVSAARVDPEPGAPGSTSDRLDAVGAAVRAWADAWSRRDVDAYVAAYVPGYAGRVPGVSRASWIEQRRKQIVRYQNIEITVSNLRVTTQGEAVVAEFDQTRRADRIKVKSHKTLELVPVGGRWLIRREVNEF
jgi:hypothetical protein